LLFVELKYIINKIKINKNKMASIDTDTLKNIFFWGFIITILAILVLGKLTRDNVILIIIITIVVVLLDILYRTYQEQR